MPRGTDRYDEARLQGRLWTPALLRSIGKLSAWFAAEGPVTGASGVISQWNDISGNANHATQSGASKPSWEPTSWRYSPIPSLGFFSSEKFLTLTTALTYSGGTGLSASVLAEHTTSAGNIAVIGNNTAGGVELRLASHKPELLRRNQASLVTSTPSCVQNAANVMGFEASTNNSAVWCNGTKTSNSTNPAFTSTLPFIGTAGGSEFWDARTAEIVALVGLWTDRERQLIDGYLGWKGGAVANFAASHPFKNRPPLIGD